MKNVFKIKYIPTGFTFELAKERCDELLKNEPKNWEIEDKDYIFDKEEEKNTTTYKKVVVDVKPSSNKQNKAKK